MHGKYINPFTDFGFKKLFGEEASKKSLMSFLNDLLPITNKITEITFMKNEQLGTLEERRKAVYDIFCKDEKGSQFIVEMQNAKQTYFKDRAVFYSTFPIQNQAIKGEWDFKLSNVYCVGLLGFKISPSPDIKEEVIMKTEYLHDVKLKNQKNEVFYDKLQYIFIEFPHFNKTEKELETNSTHLEKWLYFMKNLDTLESIPVILKDEAFAEAFKTAELANMTNIQIEEYESSLKAFRDNINVIRTAEIEGFEKGKMEGKSEGLQEGLEKGLQEGLEKGIQEGLEKGLQEGEKAKAIEIAKKMLIKGKSIDEIIEFTDLSKEEIELLRNSQ